MATLRYIGNYDVLAEGKVLFEILAQLRNFGVGRMVTKTEWMQKWPHQPSYLLVKSVQPDMDRWLWRGHIYGEWCFRGRNLGLYKFNRSLDRADWRLIHRPDEGKFRQCEHPMEDIPIPATLPLPPLQRILLKRHRDTLAQQIGVEKADEAIRTYSLPTVPYLDDEHKMMAPFVKLEPNDIESESIYDYVSNNTHLYLEAFYGEKPPVKLEKWSLPSLDE